MSSDDEFDDTENGGDESNLVKDLRKQLKDAKKAGDEFAAVVAEFNKEKRSKSVAETLAAKGAKPELAKFYTAEDASPDAVSAWVVENAELFGIGSTDSGADDETVAAAQAISEATANAPAVKIGSPEDLLIALQTKPYAELVAAGHAPSMA